MISTPITEEFVRGVAELEPTPHGVRPHRLPAWARRQFPDAALLEMERQTSGVRLVFTTTATQVEIIVHPHRVTYLGVDRARGRIDAYVDGTLHTRAELDGGDRAEINLQTGASTAYSGSDHVTVLADLGTSLKNIVVWLPHNEAIDLVELRSDAALVPEQSNGRIWLHHGSSISHGSNAVNPSEIWPAVAALNAGGVELCNLGLGGNALVDPFVARVIRDAPADLISVKLGINVVNHDSMRMRAFVPAVHGFLDTIREGHPDTPLLLISPIYCGIHEQTPGPCAIDPATFGTEQMRFITTGAPSDATQGRLTLETIREALRAVVDNRSDDLNLHYLDGLELYGAHDAEANPLPDALHPNAEAHELMGQRFADRVFTAGAVFG